jgi:hypothetical protein
MLNDVEQKRMRIDPDTCRDHDLLAAEVRRLQGVSPQARPRLPTRNEMPWMLRSRTWTGAESETRPSNKRFADFYAAPIVLANPRQAAD